MTDPREVATLRRLHGAIGSVPLVSLCRKVGISVPEMGKVLESLKQSGFAFEQTDEGIRFLSEPDWLVPQSIMARLETKIVGREVFVFRETSSTNDLARQAGKGGAAEGVVFFAEHQTAGRGTHGRKWISSSNQGLWFSILLRSQLPVDQCPVLVQMAAVTAAETVERWIGRPVSIKAPNDLYVGGGKLGGFLLETSNGWDFQVLGIGINVRSAPPVEGYATVALDQFAKSPIPLTELAAELLTCFEDWYLRTPAEAVARAFAVRLS